LFVANLLFSQTNIYFIVVSNMRVIVASESQVKLAAVCRRLGRNVSGQAVTGLQLPPQPINSAARCANLRLDALLQAHDKATNIAAIAPDDLLIAIENGIDTINGGADNRYFSDVCAVIIQRGSTRYEALSFGIPIERKWVTAAERATDANYALRDLGYQVTVGQLLHRQYGVPADNWMRDPRFGGIDRTDQILDALDRALAAIPK
jgi:non-canonical (house-cleaning) NTP pyrophosphatase